MKILKDIVVDTNVFVHSTKPTLDEFEISHKFLQEFEHSAASLCIDNEIPDSFIVKEYWDKFLKVDSYATNVVAKKLSSNQYKQLAKNAPYNSSAAKFILKNIKKEKPRDRVFAGVAYNSENKILVSHDHEDFPNWKRNRFRAKIKVLILMADEAHPLLESG
ncbi:MAG: hypothetical protein IIB41_01920 [Candidatus Marinimicrobia bacterium]|nr:hypothetical protein [Candidatus Neomarinimicrobiota bacterium]